MMILHEFFALLFCAFCSSTLNVCNTYIYFNHLRMSSKLNSNFQIDLMFVSSLQNNYKKCENIIIFISVFCWPLKYLDKLGLRQSQKSPIHETIHTPSQANAIQSKKANCIILKMFLKLHFIYIYFDDKKWRSDERDERNQHAKKQWNDV